MIRSRIATAVAVLAVAATAVLSAQADVKKYGKPLTLKETTKVSDIFANPEKFKDKRVQVEGPIVDVCSEMGCWLAIGSDKKDETIRFKVEDGVIVFPMSAKGRTGKVEGTIAVTMMTEAQQIELGKEMAKDSKTTFDPSTVKGPKVNVQIKGEAAEVR